jgi:hypothetical protein
MKSPNVKLALAGFVALLVTLYAVAQSGSQEHATPALTAAQPDAGNLRAFIELARSDLKTQKASLIAENLPLTDEEAIEFWPLHRDYEAELSKLNDQKLALIARYANSYQTMSDKEAGELANGSFNVEQKKVELKRKYFKRFSKVVPATKAARFFQLENQINLALDLQVAASLPLIK